MISRLSGSHGMVYAHEDGSFLMFLFLPLKGCRHATRRKWSVECCNEVELGSQMGRHLVPTLSEHSAGVFLGICTHKPYALKSGVPYRGALIQ